MSDFDELEDLLAEEIDAQLTSETITVHRRRVEGSIDPSTRQRAIEVSPKVEPVLCVSSPRIASLDQSGKTVVTTMWTVLKSRLSFTPSREGRVVSSDGTKWMISRVEIALDGRQFDIYGVKTK